MDWLRQIPMGQYANFRRLASASRPPSEIGVVLGFSANSSPGRSLVASWVSAEFVRDHSPKRLTPQALVAIAGGAGAVGP